MSVDGCHTERVVGGIGGVEGWILEGTDHGCIVAPVDRLADRNYSPGASQDQDHQGRPGQPPIYNRCIAEHLLRLLRCKVF